MSKAMTAHPPFGHDRGPRVREEALLIERLRTFGLVERDDNGRWHLTACGKAGLATLHEAGEACPMIETRPLRRWVPPTLASLKAANVVLAKAGT